MERTRRAIHLFLATLLLAGGAALMVGMIRTKPAPPVATEQRRVPEVEVVTLVPRDVQAPIVGYGTVRPKNQVHIIPQVAGKLVHVHKDLAPGKVIEAGEILFAIDPLIYEARVRQAGAEVTALETALRRHDEESVSLERRLANAKQMLTIDEADHQSSLRLHVDERIGTQRDLDLLRQKYLRTNEAVLELESAQARIPMLKVETQAQLDAGRARLQQAEYDLGNTRIVCPFRARVESAAAFPSQVVTGMAPIATLTDVEAFEISVGIDPAELRWLHKAVRPRALSGAESATPPPVAVTWTLQGRALAWKGRVTRFERVDELTRTARMAVEVRAEDRVAPVSFEPGDDALDPGLSIGMYCRVELPVEPLKAALWVPRHAIHEDRWVYVVDPPGPSAGAAGRLQRREVAMLRVAGDDVLVACAGCAGSDGTELQAGDEVIVSPLLKPVVGMAIRSTAR